MILRAFLLAVGQATDWRFIRVLVIGFLLSLALLATFYLGLAVLIGWLLPATLTLPWLGPVSWAPEVIGWASVLVMLGLSVFLMVPVAALFVGFFLDDIAQAVEDRHYPFLPAVRPRGLLEGLAATARFFGLVVGLNFLALLFLPFSGPFAPFLFWGLNGYLLGREYFQTVAERRLGHAAAATLRRDNMATIWLAGALMAAPLSVPVLNLLVPVLGVATFTHIFHRLTGNTLPRP